MKCYCLIIAQPASPRLTDFSLTLEQSRKLLLTFDTSVAAETCTSTGLTLQDSPTSPTVVFEIKTATCVYASGSNYDKIDITIEEYEWMLIQSIENQSCESVFIAISISAGFVYSQTGTPCLARSLYKGNAVQPSGPPPMLMRANTNPETGTLDLSFSTSVNIITINVRGITCRFRSPATGLFVSYTFTGGTVSYLNATTAVRIKLSTTDFDAIRQAGIRNASDFSIMFSEDAISSTEGVTASMLTEVVLGVANDSLVPTISSFTLDLNVGLITLCISEVIQISEVGYSLIHLSNSLTNLTPQSGYNLAQSIIVSQTILIETKIVLKFESEFLNKIKGDVNLCTSAANCFLFWESDSFRDVTNTQSIMPNMSIPANEVAPDMIPPRLVSFSVDLAVGILYLTFDEPVDVSTFLIYYLTFVSNITDDQQTVNGSVAGSGFKIFLNVTLSYQSLNFAKFLQVPLLVLESSAVADAAGNMVNMSDSIAPSSIVPDRTPPTLVGFTPVVETGQIVFTFDEFVSISSWDGSLLVIVLEVSAGDFKYTDFSEGTITSDVADQVTYTFSDEINNSSFYHQYIEATRNGSVNIRINESLILDGSGNGLRAVDFMMYTEQPTDVTPPSLIAFSLNMNTGEVQLTFSEPVYRSTVPGHIWFVNLEKRVIITNITYSSARSGPNPVWEFFLNSTALNFIKANRRLCTSHNNCFLRIQANLFVDRRGNMIQSSSSVRVMTYVQDNSPPTITQVTIDLTMERIYLQFSEPIIRSINVSKIYLVASVLSEDGISIAGSAVIDYSNLDTYITVSISRHVLNRIKLDPSLCKNNSNCHLRHSVGSYSDVSGNSASDSAVGLQVSTFTPDQKRPVLLFYILNLQLDILQLSFSEPVIVSVAWEGFIQNMVTTNNRTERFSFFGSASTFASDNITVYLDNVNGLKYNPRLASDRSNTFLVLTEQFAHDLEGNLFSQNPSEFYNKSLILDTTKPVLESFTADINDGSLILQFSELIALDSLDRAGIYLTGSTASQALSNNLSSSRVTAENYTDTIDVILSKSLLTVIKSDIHVCSYRENCIVFLLSGAVQDVSRNPIMSSNNGSIALSFIPDTTSPKLMAYEIDLDTGIVVLSFDEPVNVASFRISSLTLTNEYATQQQEVNGTILEVVATIQVNVRLHLTKESLNFAKFLQTPRLDINSSAVVDTANNTVLPTTTNTSSFIIEDITPPQLIEINFLVSHITMIFDEIINPSSWNGRLVFLALEVSSGNFNYSASTAGMSMGNISDTIAYVITDLNTSSYSQYSEAFANGTIILSVEEGFITDISGNSFNSTETFKYTTQPPDVTPPTLVSFDLDMNTGTVELTFSEPVYIVDVPGRIQFVNTSDISAISEQYNLTDMDTVFSSQLGPLPIWELQLGMIDLNALKVNSGLCTFNNNTFVIVFAGLVEDRRQNRVQQGVIAIQVNMFTPDYSIPDLINFELNLNRGEMCITYSEPILRESINLSLFGLASSTQFLDVINMTGSTIVNSTNFDMKFTVRLANITLHRIKSEPSICTIVSNCYLHYGSNSFADTSGNIFSTRATGLLVASLATDSTRPQLLFHNLDLNLGLSVLTFDEPINYDTFNPTGLEFVVGRSSLLSLSNAFLVFNEVEKTILHLRFGSNLLNRVKQLNSIDPGNLALSVANTTAEDLNNNAVIPVPIARPIPVSIFVPDSTPPQLLRFIPGSPNLTDITLHFSEYVNGSTLNEDRMNLSLITRQGEFLFSAFSGGVITSNIISELIVYSFSEADSTELAENNRFSETISLTLQIGQNFIADLNQNALLPNVTPISYTDDTSPSLSYFILDLNRGVISLFFSEPVFLSPSMLMGRLQSEPVNPEVVISFMQTSAPTLASETHTVDISTIRDNLQLNQNIGSTSLNTFLLLEETFARDVSGNYIQSVGGRQAQEVIPDTLAPVLRSFSADMNQGEMTLEFSETVRILSLDTSLLYLTASIQDQSSQYNLNGSVQTGSNFVQTVTLNIPESLLNRIKADSHICLTRENCILHIATGAVGDIAGNVLSAASTGTISSSFRQDSTRPQLMAYVVDLDSGILNLSFDEPVDSASFNVSSLIFSSRGTILQQSLNATILEGAGAIRSVISLNLTLQSLSFAKSAVSLLLAGDSTAAVDAAGNAVLPISVSNALVPSLVVNDSTPPRLLNFIPRLAMEMVLVFDEGVNTDTWNGYLVSLLLEVSTGDIEYTNFTTGIMTSASSEIVTYVFSDTEHTSALSSHYSEAIINGTIVLTIHGGFITDISGNLFNSTETFKYTTQPPDVTPPTLVSFDLDMNTGTVELTLSEPVYIVDVPGRIQFVNTSDVSAISEQHNLTDIDTVFSSQVGPLPVWELRLGMIDLNVLKVNRRLCTSLYSTFIILPADLVVDRIGNSLQMSSSGIPAGGFIPDSVSPFVTDFYLNLDRGEIVMQFSEPIPLESSNFSLFSLSSAANDLSRISMAGSTIGSFANIHTLLTVLLPITSLNAIKLERLFCTSINNCYLHYQNNSFSDTNDNIGIEMFRGIGASSLIPDSTGPLLLAHNLDLNVGNITLTFNEPIDIETFHSTGLIFVTQDYLLMTGRAVELSNASLVEVEAYNTVIHLMLEYNTVNQVKLLNEDDPGNLALSVANTTAEDLNNNAVIPVPIARPIPVSIFVPDSTPPQLLRFIPGSPNLTDITLHFSEYVNGSTLNEDRMNLSLITRQGEFLFSAFSGGVITSNIISELIVYSFSEADSTELAENNRFSETISLTLQIGQNFIADLNQNALLPNVTPISYTDDTSPSLSYFILDLNRGVISLFFSEPVFLSPSMLMGRLQSEPVNPEVVISFMQTSAPTLASETHTVDISTIRDNLQLNQNIGSTSLNTFLLLEETFARDVSGNYIQSVGGRQAQEVIPDTLAPVLRSFSADMNQGEMTLEFSETVRILSLDTSLLYLTASIQDQSSQYNLNGSVQTGSNFAQTVTLNIPESLLNRIKANIHICVTRENCILHIATGAVGDIAGNVLSAASTGTISSSFRQDSTRPQLMAYVVDLDSGILNLSFDEPVDSASFNVSSLFLSSRDTILQQSLNAMILEGAGAIRSVISLNLTLQSLSFAKSAVSLLLAGDSTAAVNAAGNAVLPISVSNALVPSLVVNDSTPPRLLNFIPRLAMEMVLVFDEGVNTDTWNGYLVSLLLEVSTGDFEYTNFTTGIMTSASSEIVTYVFSDTEHTSALSSHYSEAIINGTIVLTIHGGFITDISGNLFNSTETFKYTTQPPDVTPPTLVSFDLDMNTGTVELTFSEPVYIVDVPGRIQFVNTSDISAISEQHNLTDIDTVFSSQVGPLPVWELRLGMIDLNVLKVNRRLCTSLYSTFIILPADLVVDRIGNSLQMSSSGIPAGGFIPDSVSPFVTDFYLNLDRGEIVMQFSEPIPLESSNFSLFSLSSAANDLNRIDMAGSTIGSFANIHTLLTVLLPITSLNAIKLERLFCTSINNCYLHYQNNSFSDTNENIGIEIFRGIGASSLIPDSTGPLLLAHNLDLNVGNVTLTFSEPIDIETFHSTGLIFVTQDYLLMTGRAVELSNASLVEVEAYNTVIHLMLEYNTVNQLKLLNEDDPGNLALSVANTTAEDLNNNAVIPVPIARPIPVSIFVPDSTPPQLLRFIPGSPNLTDITLHFSEYVNGSTLNEDRMNLSLITRQGEFLFSAFSGGVITSNITSDHIVYSFSEADSTELMENSKLVEALSNGSLTLQIGSRFVTDLGNNAILPNPAPLRFSVDDTRPSLVNYTLNLNGGLLDLTFSEPVFLSFEGRGRLQNFADNPHEFVSFVHRVSLIPASVFARVILHCIDDIKINPNLASSRLNTYLVLEEMFAEDLSRNLLSPLSSGLQAHEVILDRTGPSLDNFMIDINLGNITLVFSESIATPSLNAERIYISGQQERYNLHDSMLLEGPISRRSVTLSLSQASLNAIKSSSHTCSSSSNCIVVADQGAVEDLVGNPISASTEAFASSFVADTSPPELRSYSMNLDTGLVVLSFTEPIMINSFSLSNVTVSVSGSSQPLADATIVSTESINTVFQVTMGPTLLNQVKLLSSFGPITLSLDSNVAMDTNRIRNLPISNFGASKFTFDSTPPTLLQFTPSNETVGFTLVFDEYVIPTSLRINLLSLRFSHRMGVFQYSDLSNATVTANVSTTLVLSFPTPGIAFTENYYLAVEDGSICLTLASSFIADISGNSYTGNPLAFFSGQNGATPANCGVNCPPNTFEVDFGGCQSCHEQCSAGCNGSTNSDCESCKEDTFRSFPPKLRFGKLPWADST